MIFNALLTVIDGMFVGHGVGARLLVLAFLSPKEPAFELAVNGIPLFALCSIFFTVNITFIGYYQSLERAVRSIIYTLLRGLVLLVPAFIFLPRLLGNSGLWLAIPAAEFTTCVIILLSFLSSESRSKNNQYCSFDDGGI